MDYSSDLKERLFHFATRCIKFLRTLPTRDEYKIIKYQLIKASTSSGANYNEAQAATTKADFHNKVKISLREIIESNYWLNILDAIVDVKIDRDELLSLIKESEELIKILGTIANKTKKDIS